MLSLPPIDDSIRDALEAQARHFSLLVAASTIVVAIGVVLEAVEIVHDVIVWTKRKLREKRERIDLEEVAKIFPSSEVRGEPESTSAHFWVKFFLRLGLIAVVIGVVGEWRYGAKLENTHSAIQQHDRANLTAMEVRASQIEQENIRLRIDLAKLMRSSGPRYFTDGEKLRLASVLAKYHLESANIVCVIGDNESARFGDDFAAVFAKLRIRSSRGWLQNILMTDTSGQRIEVIPSGITIWVANPALPTPVALALQKALQSLDFPFAANIEKTRETDIKSPTKYLKVLVGPK